MTSAASDGVRVNSGLTIPRSMLEYRYTVSGGPGGQHANRNRTRVEVVLEIVAADEVLSSAQQRRLTECYGERVVAVAADARSQTRNRELAEQRLADKIAEALRPTRPRRATAPSRAARQRRLSAKRRRSDVKQSRRRPTRDD